MLKHKEPYRCLSLVAFSTNQLLLTTFKQISPVQIVVSRSPEDFLRHLKSMPFDFVICEYYHDYLYADIKGTHAKLVLQTLVGIAGRALVGVFAPITLSEEYSKIIRNSGVRLLSGDITSGQFLRQLCET